MTIHQARENLKIGPLAPLYASLRRLKRSRQPGFREERVLAGWDDVARPDLTALEQAARERSQEPRLHFTLGLEYLEQGRPQQALAALERCAPLHFEAQERLALHTGRALVRLGRGNEAHALIADLVDTDLTPEEVAWRDEVQDSIGERSVHAAS